MSERVETLWRRRPRDSFVRTSFFALLVLIVSAWCIAAVSFRDVFTPTRGQNLDRFLEQIRPRPLAGRDWDWGVFAEWVLEVMHDRGFEAALSTLAIASMSVVLAAVLGALSTLVASRTLAVTDPYGQDDAQGLGWRALYLVARVSLIVMRALPEYLLAYILLLVLGANAWPVVLALAIHNAGILGRLYSETVENADPIPLRALRAAGAGRRQLAVHGLWPAVFGRALLYVFYRWETCIREATVLGMLGVVSLGYWIDDARTRDRYDQFVLFIGVGVAIVLVGDLMSSWARRHVR